MSGMSPERPSGAAVPPQRVLGFGNVSERVIEPGIAAVADLLR
jgi:GntR family transcriptional regulator/MocR family aminotransferase